MAKKMAKGHSQFPKKMSWLSANHTLAQPCHFSHAIAGEGGLTKEIQAAIPLLTWPLAPGTTISARREVSGVSVGWQDFHRKEADLCNHTADASIADMG